MQATQFQFNTEKVVMPPRDEVRRDLTRYVFCAGDFIIPNDKRQLESINGWLGGLRVGASQYEGAPTMWQTHYIIYRGMFVPLELTAQVMHADVKNTETQRNAGLQNQLPGNDILLLQDESFRAQGVVEITTLTGEPFASGAAMELNCHFFPELGRWLSREVAQPTLLSDLTTLIQKAPVLNQAQEITKEQMLNSAYNFEMYARDQIEKNRTIIMSTRQVQTGGFSFKWSARTRLFAEQLGIQLEEDSVPRREQITVRNDGTYQTPEDKELKLRELKAIEEANELRRQELELKRLELARAQTPEPVKAVQSAPNGFVPNSPVTVDGRNGVIQSKEPFGRYKVDFGGEIELVDGKRLSPVKN